jgi:hypothetical protein
MNKEQTLGLVREILTAIGALAFASFTGWESIAGLIILIFSIAWSFYYHEGLETIGTGIRKLLSVAPAVAVELGLLSTEKATSLIALLLPLFSMVWSYFINGDNKFKPNNLGLWILFFAMSFLVLPSCQNYPITGKLSYIDSTTGAKGGIVFTPDKKPSGFLKVPIYDPETGNLTGYTELQVPIETTPSK